jgi:hypothetical protein
VSSSYCSSVKSFAQRNLSESVKADMESGKLSLGGCSPALRTSRRGGADAGGNGAT